MIPARWGAPYGYRHALSISLPLVISMSSLTVMQFTDRIFLSNYSVEAIAAATPAGVASFLVMSFFMGVADYVNVIIAQFTGATRLDRVGAAVWQGIWFSLLAGAALAALALLADPLFALAGHDPSIQKLEADYFTIHTAGAGVFILAVALSCFYSGRGLTVPVMLVNALSTAVNIPLDYALINGVGPFPELGVAGAAWATVAAWVVQLVVFAGLAFSPANNRKFAMLAGWRPEPGLFGKLMRFGAPSGAQFFLDTFAITFFIFMVGRLGVDALAATNIVFAIHGAAYFPLLGGSIGASILVGQAMGAGRPDHARDAVTSSLHLSLAYMLSLGALFLFFPEPLVQLFIPAGADPEAYGAVMDAAPTLLRIMVLFSIFDAMTLAYFGGLRGAGDTGYAMVVMLACSLGVMALPLTVGVEWLGMGLYWCWGWLTAYVLILFATFRRRWRTGEWADIEVIR